MNICTSELENDFSLAMNILENEKAKQNEKISESNIYSSSKNTYSPNQNNMAAPSFEELKENIHNLKKNSSNLEIIDYPFIQNKSPSEIKLKVESNLTCMNHETELMIEYINSYKTLHDKVLKGFQNNIDQKVNYGKYLFDNYNFEKLIKQEKEKENKSYNDKKGINNNINQDNKNSINSYSENTFIIESDIEYTKSKDNNLSNKKNSIDNNNNKNINENFDYIKISSIKKQFHDNKIKNIDKHNNKRKIKIGKKQNKKEGIRNISFIIKMVKAKNNIPLKIKSIGYISSKNEKNTSESSINFDQNNYSKDTELSREKETITKNKNENINYNSIINNSKGKKIQPIRYVKDKIKEIPTGKKKQINRISNNNILIGKTNERGNHNQLDLYENRNKYKIINRANLLKINTETQQITKIRKEEKDIKDNPNINYNNLKHIKNNLKNTNNNYGRLNNKKSKSEKILNRNLINKNNLRNLANYLDSASILKIKNSNYKGFTNPKYLKRSNTNSQKNNKSNYKKHELEKNKSEVKLKRVEKNDKNRNLTIPHAHKILNKRKINNINKVYISNLDDNCKSAKNINNISFINYFMYKTNKIPNNKYKLKRDSFVNNKLFKPSNNPAYFNCKTYNASNSFLQSHKYNNLFRIESEDNKNKRNIKPKNNSKIPHNFNKDHFTLCIHKSINNSNFTYSANYKPNIVRSNTFNNNTNNKQNRKNLSSTTIFHRNTKDILHIFNKRRQKT